MKQYISIALLLCLILAVLNGCQGIGHTTTIPKTQIIYHADWPHYDTDSALVEKGDEIFEGIVTDVFFKMIDIKTGKVADCFVENGRLVLHTIYEIEITDIYKGGSSEKKYVAVMGGIPGYKEAEQFQALESCGCYEEDMDIPVLQESRILEQGLNYLFVVRDLGGDYLDIPNLEQFAFRNQDEFDESEDVSPNYNSIKDYLAYVADNAVK